MGASGAGFRLVFLRGDIMTADCGTGICRGSVIPKVGYTSRRTRAFIALGLVLSLCGALIGGCSRGSTTGATIRDTGYATAPSTPPSVPAAGSGITAEQVKQLIGSYSGISPGTVEVTECETLGNWAVAKVYARRLTNDPGESQWGVVFEKKSDAWFFKGDRVNLVDGRQAANELHDMGAPKEVWDYFGRSPSELRQTTTILPTVLTPFTRLCRAFLTSAEQEELAGTLPLSVMTFDELEWLRQGAVPITVTDVQGYRLANGDLVILFLFDNVPSDEAPGLSATLLQRVKTRYGENGKGTILDPSFGYIVVSKDYSIQLSLLVQSDRQGLPLDY